jgi:cyclase
MTEGRAFRPRVIPVLLLRDGLLSKPLRFGKATYVGDPQVAVKILSERGADEIVVLDMSATARGGPDFALAEDIAREAFMPMAYGGGIRDENQASRLLSLGIEKVVVGTAAVEDPALVTRMATAFGSQAVAVCLDVKKHLLTGYRVHTRNGTENTRRAPVELARDLQTAGAGEILLQSIDRESTRLGYDLELIRSVSQAVDLPVVALGGAGTLAHLREAVDVGASAAAAGTMFVLTGPHRAVLVTYPSHEQLDDLFT